MFSLDDRTGNAVTTIALFAIAAAIVYVARLAFVTMLLSVFFALLIEPAVIWFQNHSPFGARRGLAIAQVYLIAIVLLVLLACQLGPHLAAQAKRLNAIAPEIVRTLSSGNALAGSAAGQGTAALQQSWIRDVLLQNQGFIRSVFERAAASAAASAADIAQKSIWLFAIPILAIFVLIDGRQIAQKIVDAVVPPERRSRVEQLLQRLDTMLGHYVRAQLALSGLSFLFYTVSMLFLRFPNPIALGALGGALEFLPAVGWVLSAATILTVGYVTHSHWIWMAGLLVGWRLVQDYVNSPRIMGKELQLEPLTVVFGFMVGAELGGIAGVYLSVPVIAAIRIVWLESSRGRNASMDSQGQPAVNAKT